MDFVAIDFETANSKRESACAVGLVRVAGGKIVDRFFSYLRPEEQFNYLEPINFQIHGIDEQTINSAPTLVECWPQLTEFLANGPLIAHNAAFDKSVYFKSAAAWGLKPENSNFYCTYATAKKFLSLTSYKLPFVADALGVNLIHHHNALEDAESCAEVALALVARNYLQRIEEFDRWTIGSRSFGIQIPRDAYFQIGASRLDDFENLVSGKRISFTGELQLAPREKGLVPLISGLGGAWDKTPGSKTDYLVAGNINASFLKPGYKKSSKLLAAEKIIEAGGGIEILDEEMFRQLLPSSAITAVQSLSK